MLRHLISVGLLVVACQPALAELPTKDKLQGLLQAAEDRLNFRKLINGGGKCLDIHGPDLHVDGGKVQIWGCADNPPDNQLWRIDSAGRLVNKGNKCLDVHGPDLNADGGKVQIWGCGDAPNQKWSFDEQGRLVNGGGKCLDVHGPDLEVDGGKVQIWGCSDAPNQKWRFE